MSDIKVASGTPDYSANTIDENISSQQATTTSSSQDFDADGEVDNELPVLADSKTANSVETDYLAFKLNEQLSANNEKR